MLRFTTMCCLGLALTGCIEPTSPNFQLEDPFYLVEGDIADQTGRSEVRIRRSNFRQVQLEFDPVTGATVLAEEGAGTQVQWAPVPNEPGHYRPPADFRAAAGESWSLRVLFPDGTEAISTPELVPPPSAITGLELEFDQAGRFDENRDRFVPVFRVLLSSADRAGERNFYQWDYRYWEEILVCLTCQESRYRNGRCEVDQNVIPRNRETYDYLCDVEDGCYQETQGNRFLFVSDRTFDGGEVADNEIGDIVFTRLGGLLVEGTQYGLTAEAYEYGRTINDLIVGSSGLNAALPATLQGNLQSANPDDPDVLGYVRAVSVTSERLYLDRTTDIGTPLERPRPINLEPFSGAAPPPRAPCAGNGRSPQRPVGWPE